MATIATGISAPPQSEFTPRSRSLYRLSLEQYEAMIETGLLTKRDRCQLVEGLLLAKMTENPPQRVSVWLDDVEIGSIAVSDILP